MLTDETILASACCLRAALVEVGVILGHRLLRRLGSSHEDLRSLQGQADEDNSTRAWPR